MGANARLKIVRKVIETQMAKPYRFGSTDCFMTALTMIDTLTGSQYIERHLWTYWTARGAHRELRRLGYRSLVDFFKDRLEPIETMRCEPGDVAVVRHDGAEHVAVCLGRQFVTKTLHGRLVLPVDSVIAAFKV